MASLNVDGLIDAISNNCFSCEPLKYIEKSFTKDMAGIFEVLGFTKFFVIFVMLASISVVAFFISYFISIYREDLSKAREQITKVAWLAFKLSILPAILGLIPIVYKMLPIFIDSLGALANSLYSGLRTNSGGITEISPSLYSNYCSGSLLGSGEGLSCYGLIVEKSISWGIAAPAKSLENLEFNMSSLSAIILIMITIMGIFKVSGTSFKLVFNCIEILIKIISLPYMAVYGNIKDVAISGFKSVLNFLLLGTFLVTSITLLSNAISQVIDQSMLNEDLSYQHVEYWMMLVMLSSIQAIIPACEQIADKTTESLVSILDKSNQK